MHSSCCAISGRKCLIFISNLRRNKIQEKEFTLQVAEVVQKKLGKGYEVTKTGIIDEFELYQIALENTENYFPVQIKSLSSVLQEMMMTN